MRRGLYLGVLTAVGVLVTVATDHAQGDRAALVLHDVADNLYLLANDPSVEGIGGGGNTAIFVTADGVTLVDTKVPGYGADLLAQVRSITDKPVTTIINTHTHFDHTGSNTEFPETVEFVVHENTRAQMARANCEPVTNCDAFKGENAAYLPETTYADQLTLFSGPDRIDLYHFGRGHTDGDTFVVFREARAMHTGDMFQRKGLPFIDVANSNGSATEFGATLEKAVSTITEVDIILPGHTTAAMGWEDFLDFAGFYNDVVARTADGKAAGRTVDEIVTSYSVPSEYSDFQAPEASLRATVQYLYDGQ